MEWNRLFDAGVKAQQNGDFHQAATGYEQAERIDDRFAELRFRRGQGVLELNDIAGAQTEFAAARDLDVLRFRCDRRENRSSRPVGRGAADGAGQPWHVADRGVNLVVLSHRCF